LDCKNKSQEPNSKLQKNTFGICYLVPGILFIIWVFTKNNYQMTSTKSVQGMLYRAASGQPVEGAMVMIAEGAYEHPDIASQSDEQGTFYLSGVRVPGTYTLLINYHEQSKTVTVNITGDSVLKIPL
jgi:hypothetical protein